jgi:hypothetical protein
MGQVGHVDTGNAKCYSATTTFRYMNLVGATVISVIQAVTSLMTQIPTKRGIDQTMMTQKIPIPVRPIKHKVRATMAPTMVDRNYSDVRPGGVVGMTTDLAWQKGS